MTTPKIGEPLTAPFSTGVFEMGAAEYHAHPAIGSTTLRDFHSLTPLEVQHKRTQGSLTTDQMLKGTAVHTAVLEPHLLDSTVAVWDKLTASGSMSPRRGKVWDEFSEENAGKTIIPFKEWMNVMGIANYIQEKRQKVYLFLKEGDNERSYFAEDPATGLMLKTRPDNRGRKAGKRVLVDLKTAQSLTNRDLERAAAMHGYGQQAAHYMDTVSLVEEEPCEHFYFLFVRSVPPYDTRFLQPDPAWITKGRERNRRALDGLAKCIADDNWPGYPAGLDTLNCPEWA